jgi:hypothetical protein
VAGSVVLLEARVLPGHLLRLTPAWVEAAAVLVQVRPARVVPAATPGSGWVEIEIVN